MGKNGPAGGSGKDGIAAEGGNGNTVTADCGRRKFLNMLIFLNFLFDSMEEGDGERRVRARRSGGNETGEEVDRLSNLPDCLLLQVLSNLPMNDVVKSSALSSRWRHLWKEIHRLDLAYENFEEYNTFVSFVDRFLGFNSESPHLQSVRLWYDSDRVDNSEAALVRRWISLVVNRKVKYLHVLDDSWRNDNVEIPPSVYTCESLVRLELNNVTLADPKLISLPCLRFIELDSVDSANDSAFQVLISGCPVLERLIIRRSFCDGIQVLRVRSQSLLSFTHVADGAQDLDEVLVVEIDAPRLKCMKLSDYRIASFVLDNPVSLVQADIDFVFNLICGRKFDPNDVQKRSMIRKFLVGISNVKDLIISLSTLEVIYEYSKCEQLPLFRNLYFLRVKFGDYRWEMLPVFLESCPNLISLVVGPHYRPVEERTDILFEPRSYLSSLEYVKIERPLKGEDMEMKLEGYMEEDAENHLSLLANCAVDMNRIGAVDRLSELPDCLLCEVLLYFPTKEVVKTSVLSRRWRNLWKYVPRLDLEYGDFPESQYDAVVSFVDGFLSFESDSKLQEFSLKAESFELKEDGVWGELDDVQIPHWINTVLLKRNVEHLKVLERRFPYHKTLEIPSTVYTCWTLVALELRDVVLPVPSSVSLPRVKAIKLEALAYGKDQTFEMLISGCPVLESLYVKRCPFEKVIVYRVRSQSLLSFTLVGHDDYEMAADIYAVIDAPKLEYLELFQDQTTLSILNNLGSLVTADIDTRFNLPYEDREMLDPSDMPRRKIIRDFLMGISSVRDMVISSDTLEIIYDFSRYEQRPIPLFRNLSSLRANFFHNRWEVLPVFLQSCPNLKSLSLSFSEDPLEQETSVLPGPYSFLPTLEYVEIEKAMEGDVVAFTKLARYFLEKSTILRKFSFLLSDFSEEEESVILTKLLALPRLSSSCEVVVIR
ncbi:unnamed protein product [Microthlaspi erraticum]|uniref:F-box domain-containing protein n=1 Tax=Microthlaspi erraticum TaxID=1685480 RepID=A0A6D2LNP9_9BRAS|nr:unnamed protein product [Microthlaspi erraticum]